MAARFDAFISYSRAASSTLAVELRNGIERFAKPWYRLRSSRVFLDDASMSANTGLWSTIEHGLTEAEWFILLCSPKSAASQYVTTEIAWWLEHKSADRILLVLDEGEMTWDAAAGEFDWSRATAVNKALSKAFAEEPRWVDLSWFEQEGSLRSADPRFPERVADLAAAVRGVERDELVGENVRERRRALRLLRGGVVALSVLLVASLASTAIAVVNGNAATEQAQIAQARQLAAQAIVVSATDLQLASLLAVEAVRLHDDAQTRAALFQLQNASPYLVRSLEVGSKVDATAVSPGGTVITGSADGRVLLWNGGRSHEMFTMPDAVSSVAVTDDGQVVAGVTPNGGAGVAVSTEAGVQQLPLEATGASAESPPSYVALSPDGGYLVVSDRLSWSTVFRESGGTYEAVGTVAHGGRVGFGDTELTLFDPQGDWARVLLFDATVIDEGVHVLPQTFLSTVSADGRILAAVRDRGVNYSAWYVQGTASPGIDDGSTPSDLVSSSQIAGALDMALNADGTMLATATTGAIYVSPVRTFAELPQPPFILDGAGAVTTESLSFSGEHLANGSGDHALVWDLNAVGRVSQEFEAAVPEGCTACGFPEVRVDPSGRRVVMTDTSAFSTVVADLDAGTSVTVQPADGGYSGAAWFDAERLIVYSSAASALVVLSGNDYATVDLSIPVTLPDGGLVLVIRSDGESDGHTTLLDETGVLQTVENATGRVVVESNAFVDLVDGAAPAGFDIAPDQTTAFVWGYGTSAGILDIAADRVAYEATALDGMAYDGLSQVHVFAKGSEWVVDAATGALGAGRPAEVEGIPSAPPALATNGQLVVTGGSTGVVSLLDLDSRSAVVGRITVPVEDRKHVVSAFTPDGQTLVMAIQQMDTVQRAAAVRVVDLTLAGWTHAACSVAGRDLTASEWLTFVGTTPPADLRCDR